MNDIFEMRIRGLTMDPVTNMPIIVLKDVDGSRALPIWIGVFEANAIAMEIEKVEPPRPMTHDLMLNLLGALGARVSRVVVHDLRDNTFFARLDLETSAGEVVVDSRPSDAIALAVRGKVPIYVTREVLEKSTTIEVEDELDDDEALKRWLADLKPGDFGRDPG